MKTIRTLFFILLGTCALFAQDSPATTTATLTPAHINKIGAGRYTAVEPIQVETWEVFGDQAKYQNEEQFNGFALSTAGELGLTTGYNEMPGNKAPAVLLNPNEPIRYNGSEYWLENCKVWGKAYKNRFKPIAPPPPPTPPAPCPVCATPPPAPVAAILPMCKLIGSYETVFEGVAINGIGKFVFNGNEVSSERKGFIDTLDLNEAPAGINTVDYTVTGEGGTTTCQAKFDIFPDLTINAFSMTVKIPKARFCDVEHDGLRPDRMVMGMVEKVYCTPGHFILDTAAGGLVGFGLSRISHGVAAAQGSKPGVTVTSPK